ncbi:MAG: oxidoreductase domain protein [Bryobacterales bacterium]|nr:oxidoreductase domain protein [Bryobacterales bacterium]
MGSQVKNGAALTSTSSSTSTRFGDGKARLRKLGGHDGLDFIMLYRLLECMRKGLPPDMDVYDGATWSAPGPLSKLSVEQGSAPVKFPDFTRGRWKDRKPTTLGD